MADSVPEKEYEESANKAAAVIQAIIQGRGGRNMILVIDNYDSFTYNLVQYLGTIRPDIQVVRNDQVTLEEIEKWDPSHILLSPGPGYPDEAGICIDVVRKFQGKIPILGICLGHQAICQAYGAVIAPAKELMHGKKKSGDT